MIDITTIPLDKLAYLKALSLGLTTWTNYETGEVFIQRHFWRNCAPELKMKVLKEMEGLIDDGNKQQR